MSTAKILFISFISICIVGMFLLFSMQKSSQLSLDMEDMQLISKEKDNKIASIKDALQSANTTIKQVQAENTKIPKLKSSLETIEKEKLVYIQQLDDFQAELQNQVDLAGQRFTEIATLQEQHNSIKQAHTNLQAESTELLTAHEATLLDLENRTLMIEEFTETLVKKERVIQIYKEKLDKAAEDIVVLQTNDSNEQLNLVLILDELARKTALAKDLGNKLSTANNEAIAAGTDPNTTIAINNENQALVDKLSLENDYLATGIKELKTIIEELEISEASAKELIDSFTAEIEQLQFLIVDKDKALAALQLDANASAQLINQLSVTITAREEEVVAVKEQTMGIAAPLTEKITGLELQGTRAATQIEDLTDNLKQSQTSLATIAEEKQLINDELVSTKVAIESMQNKLGDAETNQTALQDSISAFEQELITKDEAMVTMTAALAAATSLAAENETFAAGLNEQLAASQNAATVQTTEMEERISKLIDEVATAQAVTTELTENTANLQARNDELLAALAAKEEQIEVIEDIAVEAVIEEETIIEALETATEPETEAVPEPEAVEIIVVDEVTETETAPAEATEPLEVVVVDEVIVDEVIAVEDQVTSDASVEIVAEEIVVIDEIVAEEVEAPTEQAVEAVPLQEDSDNEENM